MWSVPENFSVKIGGNYYINCENLIVAGGEQIFALKRRESDGLLGIDFKLYDAVGSRLAVIRNAHIVESTAPDDYEYRKEHHRYWITEKATGRVVCDVRQIGGPGSASCEIEVTVDLFTKSGHHFQADADKTIIGGRLHMSGCSFSNCSTGIELA